jgi:hypothetical protein
VFICEFETWILESSVGLILLKSTADILGYSIILFIVITAITIAKNESEKIIIFFVLIMFIEF